jgi:hypothetical protein
MMKILVIDGQGGRIGCKLIEYIKANLPEAIITAVGTNSIATANMLKSGADHGATGENPVVVCCKDADYIIGPLGIVLTDSMLGEITEQMASAVARSHAKRILLPVNRCETVVAGYIDQPLGELIAAAAAQISFDCKS